MARFGDLIGKKIVGYSTHNGEVQLKTDNLFFNNYLIRGASLSAINGDPNILIDGIVSDCYCDDVEERDDYGNVEDQYSNVVINLRQGGTVEFQFNGYVNIF